MTFTPQLPDDPYYDFLPIEGADITVGMDILAVLTSEGVVTFITPPGGAFWLYLLSTETPWGVPTSAIAAFPDDPGSQPSEWWHRLAMWTRTAHPDDGYLLTESDGSRWIYDAASTKMICHKSGSTYTRGSELTLGQLTTDPDDLVVADDPDWDWLPVFDGATVNEDDYVQFAWPRTGVVDDIVSAELTPGYVRTAIQSGGTDIGFYDTITDPSIAALGMQCFFYRRMLKPVIYSLGLADDGSRWIYTTGAVYFCWKAGTSYSRGAILPRGQIGLTDLPSAATSAPPLIREVLQTDDNLITSATLTTSASVIAGDVLVIVYATSASSASAPTSTAGTLTQIGTDATDGDSTGLLRVYKCPVDTSGSHTISIPSAGSADVTAVVLVLTDDADNDGFAKTSFDPTVDTATLPSVTPTGDADLLLGIYFNTDGQTFDLTDSGMVQRANPKCLPYTALAVGTVELESSAATAAAYPALMSGQAKPATVAVAFQRP